MFVSPTNQQRIGSPAHFDPLNLTRRAGILVIAGDDESAQVVGAAGVPVVKMARYRRSFDTPFFTQR